MTAQSYRSQHPNSTDASAKPLVIKFTTDGFKQRSISVDCPLNWKQALAIKQDLERSRLIHKVDISQHGLCTLVVRARWHPPYRKFIIRMIGRRVLQELDTTEGIAEICRPLPGEFCKAHTICIEIYWHRPLSPEQLARCYREHPSVL